MADKIRVFIDPHVPFGITRQSTFYSHPVIVDENLLEWCQSLRNVYEKQQKALDTMTFPTNAQAMADLLFDELNYIMKNQKRRPKNVVSEDAE